MLDNRIDYQDRCPICLKDGKLNETTGKPVTLSLDLDSGKIACVMGHQFEELPSETQAEAAPGVPVAVPEICTQPEAPKIESDSAPVVQEVAQSAAEDSAKLEQISGVLASAPTVEPTAQPVPEKAPASVRMFADGGEVDALGSGVKVGAGEAITLENGDLLLGVRVSEQWRQAVEAEAEIKGVSAPAYFAEWLTSEEMRDSLSDLLANYWLANFQQKAG